MKDIRSGEPVVVGELTIAPRERVELHRVSNEKGWFVYLSKSPAGITVDSSGETWDFDLEG